MAFHRYKLVSIAALVALAIVVGVSLAVWRGPFAGSSTASSNAAVLPSACDNFVEAARQLAEHGSAESVQMSYGRAFMAAPTASRYDTLKTLLDACDDQLVEMTSR